MPIDAVEQLPHLVRLGGSVVALEIQDLADALVRVNAMRTPLALIRESEGLCDPAGLRKSKAARIAPGRFDELGQLHDIVGDII